MIKLKPGYSIGVAPDVMFIMSEFYVHRLDLAYEPLLRKLENGSFVPDESTDQEIAQLRDLNDLNVVYNVTGQHGAIVDYMEARNWRASYVLNQLDHTVVGFKNLHRDNQYATTIATQLKECGVRVDDGSPPTLIVDVVERLNNLGSPALPCIPVKIGSYKVSIGPLLTPLLTGKELSSLIEGGKKCFETEGFLVENMPTLIKDLAINIVSLELLQLVTKVGTQEAITSIVEWDLTNMRRTVWPL